MGVPSAALARACTSRLRAARDQLVDCGYTGESVARRYRVTYPCDIPPTSSATDLLDTLVALLVLQRDVSTSDLPSGLIEVLRDACLIEAAGAHETMVRATVRLQPYGSILVASDRTVGHSTGEGRVDVDHVYNPFQESGRYYLRLMPNAAGGRLLEVCCGAAAGALLASAEASHVLASDLSYRATIFADFNRRLNGVENVRVICGDLLSALRPGSIDCVIAHPPYVPSIRRGPTFADGGIDGESITARVLSEAAASVEAGGYVYCYALVTDRKDEPFEERLLGWLRRSGRAFSVEVLVQAERSVHTYLQQAFRSGNYTPRDVSLFAELFAFLRVTQMLTCWIGLRHCDSPVRTSVTRLNVLAPHEARYRKGLFRHEPVISS